uniref:Retrotransposon gag domain-containing protein n=1 Tax=Vitis vinifera TaxID=29760 RepID=A5BST6_VITVI|nr:hypothetical protein VITISV_021832 [Vitis vinifera]
MSSWGIRMELLRIATRDIAHSTRVGILSGRHSTFFGYLTSGWERRTFKLPRSEMSESSDQLFHIRISHSQMGEEDVSTSRDHNQGTPAGHESNGTTIAEEAMNFMSYVAEVSRGWDEPNARNMGRMMSQPDAEGEMYILNEDIDMKAKIAAMARRLEELEMKKMQEVQAISQTPLQAMPCAICLSYEHLVDECPTIPTVREMLGDCNTYNSNWRNHPNFPWKPQPPQYKQHVQALPSWEILLELKKSINAQLSQRIDSVESSLNKKMDGVQNDLSQKIDNLQYSISRFANLNKVQEKGNFPSQPHQNSKGIHEMEAQKGESSMVKEVKEVITLRSGKEVDLPTSKLEHDEESETEKEKREEIKGNKKGKSIEKDDYIDEEPQRIVIKEELMKKHMAPLFLQALYGKIIQSKSQMIFKLRNHLQALKLTCKMKRGSPDRGARHMSSWGIRMELLQIATRGIAHSTRVGILSGRHSTFFGYLTSGWERRTFELPRSEMSESSDQLFHIRISHSQMGEEDVSTSR